MHRGHHMTKSTDPVIALLAGLACIAPTGHALARESDLPTILPGERIQTSDSDHKLPAFNRSTRSVRTRSVDWGTGGFTLQGERDRIGSKRDRWLGNRHQWHRTLSAGLAARQEILPGLVLGGGARVAWAKNGFIGGPLLSRRTHALSQEAFVSLQGAGHTGVRLSVFDRGGWSPGAPAESANRMVNGELRARKGAAVEVGLLGNDNTAPGFEEPRLALRFERATSPSLGRESSAVLALDVRF